MTDKIIVALDFDRFSSAREAVERLPDARFFKVGLQGYLQYGEAILALLREKGKRLFLDLKFKDIPNTVSGAVRSSLKYEPDFLTVHLTGGEEMVRQALEAAGERPELTILGVTVLTSLGNADLLSMGMPLTVADTVLKLCELGLKAGLKAFVCSPLETERLRRAFGRDIVLVTPGIRPQWSEKGDQERVFTPRLAVEAGSDYLVIGRPITQHRHPDEAFRLILREMEGESPAASEKKNR
jgi:orotidine-5'-phosphate decarboxylase